MIIDSDAHVLETAATWDFIDPEFSHLRPNLVVSTTLSQDKRLGEAAPTEYWVLDGNVAGVRMPSLTEQQVRAISKKWNREVETPDAANDMQDVELRLSHMDKLGIDIQVLYNTIFIFPVTERPETEVAVCRAWNRWMADVWKRGRGRLRWTCVVPTLSLDEARKELEFSVEHGAVGMYLRGYEHDLLATDPYFYPLFQRCQDLDIPVVVHSANGSPALMSALKTRQQLTQGFVITTMPAIACCHALIGGDIQVRFPKLRWGFVEIGASWIPWLVRNLIRRGAISSARVFEEKRIFVEAYSDDDISFLADYVGKNVLVAGTDYGHVDVASEVDAIEQMRQLAGVAEDVKRRILSDNPRALYGL